MSSEYGVDDKSGGKPLVGRNNCGLEIIGIGCRFAGDITDVDSLWKSIVSPHSLIDDIPDDRFDPKPFLGTPGEAGKSVTFRGGWLRSVDRFDSKRFRISPREAREMDPQQRLFLEVSFEALHDAGLNPDQLRGRKVGVYVGTGTAEHQAMSFAAVDDISQHTMSGNSLAVIANRLSYLLDLDGPSLAVDTACSAAMTAFCLACDALRNGNCDYAVVGGTNVMLGPSPFVGFSQARMLSPRGVCAPFDATADGFVRGEGCGVVILRRSDVVPAYPTRIYATVAGYGTNEDGRTASLTIPDEDRQRALYSSVLAKAHLAREDIVFVEAHGTGTPVGDPIEARSIAASFVGNRSEPLTIGSIKGHIGHLETAAGIAGIIKSALSLFHGALPPTAGHTSLPQAIDTDALGIQVSTKKIPLPVAAGGGAPTIAVCSYGFGGANGVALLSKAGSTAGVVDRGSSDEAVILPLSADTPDALSATQAAFGGIDRADLKDAARWASHSLPRRRVRCAALVRANSARTDQLEWLSGPSASKPPRLSFAFSGQGSHTADMGSALFARFDVYRVALTRAAEVYADITGQHLIRDCALAQPDGVSEVHQRDIRISIPAVVLTQVASVELLKSVGVQATISFGHSVGEMTAAWSAGLLDLEELCRLTALRAEAQAKMPGGRMAALTCGPETAREIISVLGLSDAVAIAAVNAADAVTIAGKSEVVGAVSAEAERREIAAIKLQVPKAYHSPDADIAATWLGQHLTLSERPAPDGFVSATGGRAGALSGQQIDADHWVANVRNPVDFHGACQAAAGRADIVLEIAPRPALTTYLRRNVDQPVVAIQRAGAPADEGFLQSIARLFVAGIDIDFAGLQPPKRFLNIPRVPWDHSVPLRSAVWRTPRPRLSTAPSPRQAQPSGKTRSESEPSLTAETAPVRSLGPGGRLICTKATHGYLEDHTIEGNSVIPGAALVAHAFSATSARRFEDVRFKRFVPLFRKQEMTQLDGEEASGQWHWVGPAGRVFSCTPAKPAELQSLELPIFSEGHGEKIDTNRVYRALAENSGIGLNGAFRSIVGARLAGARLTSELQVTKDATTPEAIVCLLIDGAMQSLALVAGVDSWFFAPLSIEAIEINDQSSWPRQAIAHAHLTSLSNRELRGDVTLLDKDGVPLARLSGVTLKKMRSGRASKPSLFSLNWCPSKGDVRDAAHDEVVEPTSPVQRLGASKQPIFFAGGCPPDGNLSIVEAISDAAVVVDDREDVAQAAMILSEAINAPHLSALVLVHRIDTDSPSPIPGFARAARNEHTELDIYSIGVPRDAELAPVIEDLLGGKLGSDRELRLSREGWLVPRLQPARQSTSTRASDYRLDVPEPGQLQSLRWRPMRADLEGLDPHEVRLRVSHVSLHFKDVMLALGLLPGFSPIIGMECAGVIDAVGEKVSEIDPALRPGREVLVLAMTTDDGRRRDALFGTMAIADARNVFLRPEGLNSAAAAAFLGVYATAWHALVDVARIEPNETVLIHSGAGGVGQAAVQIAQKLGAKVIASAGNAQKRAMLAERLNVSDVIDSHSPSEFVAEIDRITNGRGVDVTLNSLAGEGLRQTLATLAPGGRHVEIGKRDILENSALGLQVLKNNVTFHSVHLDLLAKSHPKRIRDLVLGCIDQLARGDAKPIETTVFHADEVIKAFRHLGSGRHTGKIVVDLADLPARLGNLSEDLKDLPCHPIPDTLFPRRESILISGGMGGLGLGLARFMAERGAGRILLAGRFGAADDLAERRLESIRSDFPEVQLEPVQLDVSNFSAVAQFVSSEPTLCGVVHAATQFEAGPALSAGQDWGATWQTKVRGAENLDRATRQCAMRFFVLVGSLAGLHGNTQQAAYVSSNAALAVIAEKRRVDGYPAVSIDMPILLGAGRLADPRHVGELIFNMSKGFSAISFQDLEPLLEEIFAAPERFPPHLAIDHPDWSSYLALNRNSALFDHLVPNATRPRAPRSEAVSVRAAPKLSERPPIRSPVHIQPSAPASNPVPPTISKTSEMSAMSLSSPPGNLSVNDTDQIRSEVFGKIAFVLGAEVSEVDPEQPLIELGIDSLAATELHTWVDRNYGVQISQSAFLSGLTGEGLVDTVIASGISRSSKPPPEITSVPDADSPIDLAPTPMRFAPNDELPAPVSNGATSSSVRPVNGAGAIDESQSAADAIRSKLAFVLGARPDEVDDDIPLIELGIDSLAATELAAWMLKTYAVQVSQTQFLSGITLSGLTEIVIENSDTDVVPVVRNGHDRSATAAPLVANSSPANQAEAVAPMSIKQDPGSANDDTTRGHRVNGFKHASAMAVPKAAAPATPKLSSAFIDVPLASVSAPQAGHRTVYVPERLTPKTLEDFITEFESADQVIVLRRSPNAEHFCLGMDLEQVDFGSSEMSLGLERFRILAETIKVARMPVIVVVEGACRGGGVLFPSLATIVIAGDTASFGLPEIRRGGLPGLVSVYAAERVNPSALKTLILTGEAWSANEAKAMGLADILATDSDVESELTRILRRFVTIEPRLLADANTSMPAETPESALIAMGGLDRRERTRERDDSPLVRLRHNPETGVGIITLADPEFSNAIDWAIADDLSRAIEAARKLSPLRAVVLEGEGEHFCVGVNPYNFIKRTKQLPLLTAARVTYEIYKAFVGIRELGIPVIAAVQGKVMGGGLAAILNADYRITTEGATFNYGNLPRGVCPGLLMSENLARTVGSNWATELYMNDYTLSADQAREIGLVHQVVENTGVAQAGALSMAERIAGYAPLGVKETLGLMRPNIDYTRLARESIGIARCNVLGNAFAPGWKAAERRIGDAPAMPRTVEKDQIRENPVAWDWSSDVFVDFELGSERSGLFDAGSAPVLLTGATGFLGTHILQALLRSSGRHVVCLIRGADSKDAKKRLLRAMSRYELNAEELGERVTVVPGDVAEDNLGLDDATYQKLSQACGVIIHNAACVDFTVSYERLKATNVDGVRNVARFAASSVRSQLIHVSSLSVFSLHHFVGEATDLRPDPSRLINGYARSKWVGEQIAFAAAQKGLDVSVVRPGRIMGNSETGVANPEDWFTRYLQTCIVLGKAWAVEHETDMTPVDSVARLIVSRLGKSDPTKTWHAISSRVLLTSEINRALLARGYRVEPVSFDAWMDAAAKFTQEGMGPLLATFRSLPGVGGTPTKLQFSTDLPAADEPAGDGLLEKMLSWLSEKGLLPSAPQTAGGQTPDNPMLQAAMGANKAGSGDKPRVSNGNGTQYVNGASSKNGIAGRNGSNAGIHAMELYFPQHAVSQADMERAHECPGKYTAGLGQEAITFCGEDEDAVSMALTAVHRLLERTGIGWDQIGRLEVGTESLVDRSKSIKTHLMALFGQHGQHDIEGVDAYNACYGGTAALFNAVSWCQSEAWDGRYAIVVAVDIADLDSHQAFLNGAACVAMLIGPDAPVVMEPARASHMMHTWDFYKPVGWKDPFPLMRDGAHSIDVYMACLAGCYGQLTKRRGINLLDHHDHVVFHCTSTYLCKRAFDQLTKLARPSISLKERQALYREKTEPTTRLTKQIGSTYTASCYVNLYSLLSSLGEAAKGRSILVFSYGSGAASSMYSLSVRDMPMMGADVDVQLEERVFHAPETFLEIAEAYSAAYARFDFHAESQAKHPDGVYTLVRVDEFGIREYARHMDGQLIPLLPDMAPATSDLRPEVPAGQENGVTHQI